MSRKGGPSVAMIGGGIKSVSLGDFDRFLDFLANEQTGSAEKTPSAIYKSVAWAYRCVNLRAWGVSSVPYIICARDAKEDDAKPVDFPLMTRDLLWRSEAAECLWAVNYVLKAQNVAGVVKQLQWLNPLTMTPETKTGTLTGFTQRAGSQERNFTPEQIIYAPQFNPMNDLGPGVSPMQVAMEASGLAANANAWAARFFSHGAIPAVILSTEKQVDDLDIERIRTAWERLTGGIKNAWRTVILRNGLKPTIVGMPVKDLAMPQLFQQVRAQIACAFEIPETMLSDAANYATSAEHRRSFWLETIIPHAEWHVERFNEQLFWPLDLEMRLRPNELEAVQKDEADKAASMKAMIDAATAVFGAKLCDEEEARAIISSAFEQMSLPKLATGWKPPEPKTPPQLQPFPGQNPPPGQTLDQTGTQPNPLAKADLERWQRKCEKAGKAKPFESEHIPAGMKTLIEDRLKADAGTTFDFLKTIDTARLENERRLQSAIAKELGRYWGLVATAVHEGLEPDWGAFSGDMVNAIDDILAASMTEQMLRDALAVGIDMDPAVANIAAWRWARQYSYDLVKGITETTRNLVSEATAKFISTPGMTVGDLRALLEFGFSADRAAKIATTEITRAYSSATSAYQEMLAKQGIQMRRVWTTSNDDRVCDICAPLDNTPETKWPAGMGGGPPAHVNCRCSAELEYVGRK